MKTTMSFLWPILGTLNMSRKYRIVQYLYKKFNITPHLFAHGSPHVCDSCCLFILLRLGPTNFFVLHEDYNVIFVIHINYIEQIVS